MRIKESKNLKYDKIARVISYPEDYDKLELEPRVCILDRFEKMDGTLTLYFKNSSEASIKAKNIEGDTEISFIQIKLTGLIGRSYEEILEMEII